MEINYTIPLRRAWERMRVMLFRPFHLENWLVVGLAVFIANLAKTGGGLFSWKNSFPLHHADRARGEHVLEHAHNALDVLLGKPVVLLVVLFALVMAGALVLVIAWASARAKLVFLENVAAGRASFMEPWRRFGRLGQSLFLWYAAFSFAVLLPIVAVALPFASTLADMARGLEFVRPSFGAIAVGVTAAILLGLVLAFVGFLTSEFVEPLMLMHDETTSRAWSRFWPLLTSHAGEFIAYALFIAVTWIAVVVALAVAGVATCCIGLLLMLIPYVNSVVLLPIEVTGRACGPEFLAQFGPEWDLFAATRAVETKAPEGPPPG